MDEMQLRREAEAAERLLTDPILNKAIEKMEERAHGKIEASRPDQPEVREAAYYELKAAKQVKAELQDIITNMIQEQRKAANV